MSKIIKVFLVMGLLHGTAANAYDPVAEKKEQEKEVAVEQPSAFESAQSYVAHKWATMVDNAKKLPAFVEPRQFISSKAQNVLNNVYVAGLWTLGTAGISAAMRYSKTARAFFTNTAYYEHARNYVHNVRNGDRKTLAYTGAGIATLMALYYRKEIAATGAQLLGFGKSSERAHIDRGQLDQIDALQRQLRDARRNETELQRDLEDARRQIDTITSFNDRLKQRIRQAYEENDELDVELTREHLKRSSAKEEIEALENELDAEKRKRVLLETELNELCSSDFLPFSEAKENLRPFNLRTLTIAQLRALQAEIEAEDKEFGPLDHVNLTLSFDRDGYTGHALEVHAPHQDLDETIDE